MNIILMLYLGLYHTLHIKTIVYMFMKKPLKHNLRLISKNKKVTS